MFSSALSWGTAARASASSGTKATPPARIRATGQCGGVLAREALAPGRARDHAEDDVAELALAVARHAGDADQLPGRDGEIDVGEPRAMRLGSHAHPAAAPGSASPREATADSLRDDLTHRLLEHQRDERGLGGLGAGQRAGDPHRDASP